MCMIGGIAVIARGDAQRAVARTIPDIHDDPEDPVTTLLLLLLGVSSLSSFRCVGTARIVVVFGDDTKDDDEGDEGLATSPRAIVGATKATTASDAATIMTTTTRNRMMTSGGNDDGREAGPKNHKSQKRETKSIIDARSRFGHTQRPKAHTFVCPNSDSVCPNSDKKYLTVVTFRFLLLFFAF